MIVREALRNKEKAKLGGGRPPTNWHRSSEKIMTEKRIVDADALARKRWRQDDDDHYVKLLRASQIIMDIQEKHQRTYDLRKQHQFGFFVLRLSLLLKTSICAARLLLSATIID